jgi:hypothetical protein
MERYLEKRREFNGAIPSNIEQGVLAGWYASIVQAMDADELKMRLLDVYTGTHLDMNVVDVLSNDLILDTEPLSPKVTRLKFKGDNY